MKIDNGDLFSVSLLSQRTPNCRGQDETGRDQIKQRSNCTVKRLVIAFQVADNDS